MLGVPTKPVLSVCQYRSKRQVRDKGIFFQKKARELLIAFSF